MINFQDLIHLHQTQKLKIHQLNLQAVFINWRIKMKKKIQLSILKEWIRGFIKQLLIISIDFLNGMILLVNLHLHFPDMNTAQIDTDNMKVIFKNLQTIKILQSILKVWILGFTKQRLKTSIHFLNGMILWVNLHPHFLDMNMAQKDIETMIVTFKNHLKIKRKIQP